ncbi:MAG: twin-arginine translocase TatA/TatE family subunit [Treponemataceae bacterium]
MSVGLPEIVLVLFLVLLLFGGKRLPELARGMGKALSEFRKGVRDVEDAASVDPPKTDKPDTKA